MKISTFLKVFIGVVGTILIGAIGSGVWEKLLSPLLEYFYRFVVEVIDGYSSEYKDTVYKRAALGFHETYSLRTMSVLTIIVGLIMLMIPFSLSIRSSAQSYRGRESFRGKMKLVLMILSIAFLVMTSFLLEQHQVANSVITHVVRSSEILRPYVGEVEYRRILSDFYQIQSAEEFYLIHKELLELGEKHKVIFSDFDAL
jgi:hypothetical protein